MWGLAALLPTPTSFGSLRLPAAIALAVTGAAFSFAGIMTFRRAKTTVNPLKPETATSLVRSGVYGRSRNPMYVGLALMLAAWAVWLSSVWTWLGPVAFVLYMNRFQIAPEERAMAKLFGTDFEEYKASVRRWL